MGEKTEKLIKKIKSISDDVSDLLKGGIQGSLEKTKKKYGSQENKKSKTNPKRPQGGWKD